mgnify:CR=1 FL=1
MAKGLVEVPLLRTERSKTFYKGGSQYILQARLPVLCYQTIRGSGVFDADVDLAARVLNGLEIVDKVQYGLTVNPKTGLISFAGRKNTASFDFKLMQSAYMNWDTLDVSTVDSNPNFSGKAQTTNSILGLVDDSTIAVESTTHWAEVFPGVDYRRRRRGDQIKDDILFSVERRETLKDMGDNQVFGFIFDISEMPAFYRDGLPQNSKGVFDSNGKALEFRTASGDFLGSLPPDFVYAFSYPRGSKKLDSLLLRKRIWHDGSGWRMFIGLPVSDLRLIEDGVLVFDPTINLTVTTGNDDGDMQLISDGQGRSPTTGSTMTLTANLLRAGWHGTNNNWTSGARFLNVTIAQGTTITLAEFSIAGSDNFTSSGTVEYHVSAQAADNAGAFSTSSGDFNIGVRARSTADDGIWDVQSQLLDTYKVRTVTTTCQEIINRVGWVSGNAIVYLLDSRNTCTDYQEWRSYNYSSSLAPKLDITYSGGGTTYPLTVGGTLTPVGGLIKQPRKIFLGTLTPAGALAKQTNKTLAGSLTPAGAERNQPNKVTAGTLTPTGTERNQPNKAVGGTLNPTGTLIKQDNKATGGTLNPVGLLQKQANKLFGGTLTPAGTLANIKTAILNVGGTLAPTGTLIKQVGKALSGNLPSSGLLIKQVNKVFAGTLNSSGTLSNIKTVVLSVGGTLNSSGALIKQVGKSVGGTLSPAGGLIKLIRKFFGGLLTPTGTLTASKTGGSLVAGFDIADTQSYPVLFEQPALGVVYDRTQNTVYFDETTLPVLFTANTIPTIYGDDLS